MAGFGLLVVFFKKYGPPAMRATYLLVSVDIPLDLLNEGLGILGSAGSEIDGLTLAEFAAAKE